MHSLMNFDCLPSLLPHQLGSFNCILDVLDQDLDNLPLSFGSPPTEEPISKAWRVDLIKFFFRDLLFSYHGLESLEAG